MYFVIYIFVFIYMSVVFIYWYWIYHTNNWGKCVSWRVSVCPGIYVSAQTHCLLRCHQTNILPTTRRQTSWRTSNAPPMGAGCESQPGTSQRARDPESQRAREPEMQTRCEPSQRCKPERERRIQRGESRESGGSVNTKVFQSRAHSVNHISYPP